MNPKLIVREGLAKGQVYEIVKPEIAIGRYDSNSPSTLGLKDIVVSRNHCRIIRRGDTFLVQDANSHNGTYVNGSLVKEIELKHKDEIRVGKTKLQFWLHEEGDEGELNSTRVRLLDDDPHTQSMILLQSKDSLYLKDPKQTPDAKPAARIERNYQMLLQLGREINSIRNLDKLQQRLLELIFSVIPAERGAILTTVPGEGKLTSRADRFKHEQTEGQEWGVSRTILRKAKDTDGGVWTGNIEPELLQDIEKSLVVSGAKSVLAARLMVSTEVFGVIYLDTTNQTELFDGDHLQLLTAIANLAAGALETAQFVERLNNDKKRLQDELDGDRKMVGQSGRMQDVRKWVEKVAKSNASALIRGESGTGKELVARAIHQNSERKDKPFIAINCAAIPETLIESELFGSEKGAFSGALSRKGKFELADGGTIFLDEIGELKMELQAKLLRAVQEFEIERVGGTRLIKVNVRLIAATNKDLEAAIQTHEFRKDLFYRLNVLTISMPSLRERQSDIPELANYFLAKYASECKHRVMGISQKAMDCLLSYSWQGNIRELENAIESAMVMTTTDWILPEDLPDRISGYDPDDTGGVDTGGLSEPPHSPESPFPFPVTTFRKALKEAKKWIVRNALDRANGNRTEAAKLLDIHANNLDRYLRDLNLRPTQTTRKSKSSIEE
ncbi:MAG: sigma 54-interacting transcriptional regulator [Blastocatellia bacterium]